MRPMMLRVALAPAGGREGARPGPQRPSPDRCGLRHGRDPVRGAMCRECPRAQALRKWVRTPIWTLGMVQGGDAPAGPSDRMGSRGRRDGPHAVWAGVAAPSIIGCDLILAVHGSLVTSVIESAGAMGFAAWVVLGVVAGWIACSIPPDCEPTQAGRMLVGVLGAVLGGVVASLLGVGSAATFFSLGAWLVAGAGATASLAIHSIHVGRSRPPHPPATR